MRSLRSLAAVTTLALALAAPQSISAQGCTQCRDNVSQSSPEFQAALREGIAIMLAASITIFSAALLVMRRNR